MEKVIEALNKAYGLKVINIEPIEYGLWEERQDNGALEAVLEDAKLNKAEGFIIAGYHTHEAWWIRLLFGLSIQWIGYGM